ncbi:sugar ABC transporter substrate-binding protein [Agromyces sp. SYSU K20354]|uniref:ABC transporter substrate-binding protein n=1 Tax=Agromyces cavernae TaxID=2898659 RepID=UPI001E5CD9AC|nr:sugar ABC transporter substrate-binding protein [Agromyces cavernae]MCD2443379.1 sugar ABC transporter substrate-binding protein [Agromyces cavernae]
MELRTLTRVATGLTVGVVAAAALAGCTGDSGSSSAGGDQTVTVWTAGTSAAELLAPAVAEFEDANPGTTIDVVDVGNPAIWEKITTSLAAGGEGLPDIMQIGIDYLPGYTEKFPGAFADLSTLGADDLAADFAPSAWGGGMGPDGELWGVPFEVNTAGFTYNKSLFDAAGIDMSTITTWDELIEAGVTLKAKTGASLFELDKAATNHPSADIWQTLTQQQGSFYFNADGEITLNSAEGAKSLELLKKANDLGVLADAASFTAGGASQYADGSVATNVDASWWAGYFEDAQPDQAGKWAVALRPAVEEGGATAALAGASYLSIAGNSEHKDAAWEFIAFALGTLEGQEAMQTAHAFTPGFTPVYSSDGFTDGSGFYVGESPSQIFVDSITQPDLAVPTFTSDYARAIKIYADAQTKVLISGADPQEALDEAAQLLADATGREIAG